MKKIQILILSLSIPWFSSIFSQAIPEATTPEQREKGYVKKLSHDHILQNLELQSVGPTYMGGRVVDVDVNPEDPSIYLIAYASGGLWITENNGQSYRSIFDNEMVLTIGDIAVDWKGKTIWIGTGENNSSRSSYSGFGIYKSTDEGKTWKNMGLKDSHHIGRIIMHPDDPNILWVAAMGHLYSDNSERGVFKSTDAGISWKKVLFIDEKTGAIDLIADPKNPNILYASMWYRERKAWNFTEGGSSSGIYKTVDGGENWKMISDTKSGFVSGSGLGRIGLAISHQNSETIYALLDNQHRREKEEAEDGLTKEMLKSISSEDFLDIEEDDLKKYLKDNHFPKKYSADSVKAMVRLEMIEPVALAEYIEDANSMLFDTEVIGAQVYKSENGGNTWSITHAEYLDDLVHSYGYYFGQIRLSPLDDQKVYLTGVPLLKSMDGGKTFKSINGKNQHVDHHALWINPKNDNHLINGNDGGINVSRDEGENWLKVKSPPVGQFYTVNVDEAKPYNIYGGLQDNGVWKGSSNYKEGVGWQSKGVYPYELILGGDGFKIEIDNRDNNTTYTGYQFGNYFRFKSSGGQKKNISPKHELGERPFRFNWQTPIHLSRHNQDIFYIGSNKFHRSMNRGDDYDLISKDLTKGGKKGDVAYGTMTYIHESPLRFGKIYIGTDDGLVYRSDNVGYNWENINSGLPENLWVTCIQASAHDTNRVYLSLNGYRWDHFDAYLFVSENNGKNWKRLGLNLPKEPVNVIKEDPFNEQILYLGTDHGLYISLNRGKDFYFINNGIPSVAVHDLVIQEREKDMVVATHGRSIYKVDVTELQELDKEVLAKGIHLFKISSKKYNENWGKQYNQWKEIKTPELLIPVYVKEAGSCDLWISINDEHIYFKTDTLEKGLNYITYDLSLDENRISEYLEEMKEKDKTPEIKKADNGKYYLLPGKYEVMVNGGSEMIEKRTFKISSNEEK